MPLIKFNTGLLTPLTIYIPPEAVMLRVVVADNSGVAIGVAIGVAVGLGVGVGSGANPVKIALLES